MPRYAVRQDGQFVSFIYYQGAWMQLRSTPEIEHCILYTEKELQAVLRKMQGQEVRIFDLTHAELDQSHNAAVLKEIINQETAMFPIPKARGVMEVTFKKVKQ